MSDMSDGEGKDEADIDVDMEDLDGDTDMVIEETSDDMDSFWLQDDADSFPKLELPESSKDLNVKPEFLMKALSVFQIMHRYSRIVKITPFDFEIFLECLHSPEVSNLLSEIHIALIKLVLKDEDSLGTIWGPQDHSDSIKSSLYFLDHVTWPETLSNLLFAEKTQLIGARDIREANPEYPLFDNVDKRFEVRLEMISQLCDYTFSTSTLRWATLV